MDGNVFRCFPFKNPQHDQNHPDGDHRHREGCLPVQMLEHITGNDRTRCAAEGRKNNDEALHGGMLFHR